MNQVKNLKVYEGMLIIVDMVDGFVNKGILHDKEIKKTVKRQIELIKEAKQKGYAIVFIKDTHTKDSIEHKRFPDVHCIKGSGEEELIEEFKPFENDEDTFVIEKNSTSFMEAPEFRKLAKEATNIKKVEIAGCCTDICVFNGAMGLANFYDQRNQDVNIYVHQDAVATFAEKQRQNYINAAYLLMQQQGINIIKEKEVQMVKKR